MNDINTMEKPKNSFFTGLGWFTKATGSKRLVSPFVKGGPRGICGLKNSGLGRQRGVALVVALVLLVVVTLVGLAAIRGTTMQQQMTSNFYDREIGFQAAEAGLRDGEAWVTNSANAATARANRDCTAQQCVADPFDLPQGTLTPLLHNVATSTFDAGALGSGQPQYVVEFMGACNIDGGNFKFTNDENGDGTPPLVSAGTCYRVTARSNPNATTNERSNVILQSIVRG